MSFLVTLLYSHLSVAQAEPPSLSAAIQTTAGAADAAGSGSVGHDVRLGFLVADRLLVEGISASSAGRFELRPGARWFISEPWTTQGALSLTASAGLATGALSPMLTVGGGYDFPLRGRMLGRAGLELVAYGDTGLSGVRASIGLTLPPRDADVIIQTVYIERPVEPEPVVEEAPVEVVWMPDPICDWMPADEASQLLAEIERTRAGESAPPEVEPPPEPVGPVEPVADPSGTDPEPAPEAPAESIDAVAVGEALASAATDGEVPFWSAEEDLEGSLIVLAHPGDRVLIGGEEAEVDETGVARLTREEGPVTIEVYSGGQQQQLRAALVPKHAVWVRAGDPDPTAVFFKLNSSELSRATRADIQTVATYAASWSFVLQGGYSPEGGLERNRQLAIERARAVSRAMQEAGIDEDRIVYLDPPPPDPNRPPEEQRNCRIIPVAPGGER